MGLAILCSSLPMILKFLSTGVYRKPTHTNLYLPSDSHHNLSSKYSVINTLTHRAKATCSTQQLLKYNLKHLEEVLMWCKYPQLAINKILHKQEDQKCQLRKGRLQHPNKL